MFKDIAGFENRYSISEDGQIFSHLTNKILKNYLGKRGYWVIDLKAKDGRRKIIPIHRLLFNTFKYNYNGSIDHINGDSTDNRLENLRPCTHRENMLNSKSRVNSSSKYKGVSFCKMTKKWKVQIKINNKNINLGRFNEEKTAAGIYDIAALLEFGRFAKTNILNYIGFLVWINICTNSGWFCKIDI